MSVPPDRPDPPVPAVAEHRAIKWDAVAAIIASLVGLLALIVAAYTAYIQRYTANIQREQVSAQVWPYLISGNNDLTQSLVVDNKGVGPAIVRSVQVKVDGKPQTDWHGVWAALGLSSRPPDSVVQTTINHYVVSPGEDVQIIHFPDKGAWQRFRGAAFNRISIDACFCSTLDQCWMSRNRNLIGPISMPLQVRVEPIRQCPRLTRTEVFNN